MPRRSEQDRGPRSTRTGAACLSSEASPWRWLNAAVISAADVGGVRGAKGFAKSSVKRTALRGQADLFDRLFLDDRNSSRTEPDEGRHGKAGQSCDRERELRAAGSGEPAG